MLLASPTPAPDARGAALLVHGGAWAIPDAELDDHRAGLRAALGRGSALLERGASALNAVVETVAGMEACGAFNAGRGAVLTRGGAAELDAGVMDGATLAHGAVIGARRIVHPARLAAYFLRAAPGDARTLAGEGAEAFAEAAGVSLVDPASLVHPRERARHAHLLAEAAPAATLPRGTVGCVARDRAGRLAACTSTGGTPLKPSGRVGDSPLVGAGFYADARGAVSCTGGGEAITASVLAARTADALAHLAPVEAARERLGAMYATLRGADGAGATGGLIVLGADGAGAWAYSTPRMARAAWADGAEAWLGV